jgi:hypothetical protein
LTNSQKVESNNNNNYIYIAIALPNCHYGFKKWMGTCILIWLLKFLKYSNYNCVRRILKNNSIFKFFFIIGDIYDIWQQYICVNNKDLRNSLVFQWHKEFNSHNHIQIQFNTNTIQRFHDINTMDMKRHTLILLNRY